MKYFYYSIPLRNYFSYSIIQKGIITEHVFVIDLRGLQRYQGKVAKTLGLSALQHVSLCAPFDVEAKWRFGI